MAKNLLLFTYFFLFWSQDMLAVLGNHGYRDTGAHNCTIYVSFFYCFFLFQLILKSIAASQLNADLLLVEF